MSDAGLWIVESWYAEQERKRREVEPKPSPPSKLVYTKPDKSEAVILAQVEDTMAANPPCAVCGFGFTKAVTFCPNCGARRC